LQSRITPRLSAIVVDSLLTATTRYEICFTHRNPKAKMNRISKVVDFQFNLGMAKRLTLRWAKRMASILSVGVEIRSDNKIVSVFKSRRLFVVAC
jgi:hypothetical protein